MSTECDQPHRDRVTLRRLYIDRDLTMREVGERLGVSQSTIKKWLDRNGIEKDTSEPWHDENWLWDQYWGQGKSLADISDEVGASVGVLHHWMEKFGIERRGFGEYNVKSYAQYRINPSGYAQWRSSVPVTNEVEAVLVHRLLAVAEYGFEAVCGDVVHHKNGVKWDNRPSNIEVMSASEHGKIHAPEPGPRDKEFHDPELLNELYHERGLSQKEIADKFDVARTTIQHWLNEFGLAGGGEPVDAADQVDFDSFGGGA